MKNLLIGRLSFLLWCIVAFQTTLPGQTPKPIAFGQCLTDTLATQSSSKTFLTPIVKPGDVLLIRTYGDGMRLKLEVISPSGTPLFPVIPGNFDKMLQTIHKIPVGSDTGVYKIIVSNNGVWTGDFTVSLERLNDSGTAKFLECDKSATENLNCRSKINGHRFLMQGGSRSRIRVIGDGTAPEVWLCNRNGDTLRHQTGSLNAIITFDTILTPTTECLYVFVASRDGFFYGDYSITHTTLSGNCGGVSLATTPASGAVCAGQSFTLSAAAPLPNTTFSWSGPNGFTATTASITLDNADVSMSGAYTVTASSPGVCNSTAVKIITVNPLPSAQASVTPVSGAVCAGQSFTLNVTTNASSPISYQWTKLGGGYSSTSKSPIVTTSTNADTVKSGTYVIQVTDGKGCSQTDSIDVAVNPKPSANINLPINGEVCLGSTLTLNVATNAADPNFSWSGPQGFSSALQSPNIPNAALTNAGTYSVTVTNGNTGCSSTATRSVSVRSLPSASISGTNSICKGQNTTLTAFGGGTYSWSSGQTTAAITISPAATQAYTVTVTSSTTGCTNTATETVTVKPLPSLTINIVSTPPDLEICAGEGNILLCANSGASNPTYTWTSSGFSSTQQCVSFSQPSQSGTYVATVKDGSTQCSSSADTAIVIHPVPTVSILQNPQSPHCNGDNFILCSSSNATSPMYAWSGPNNLSSSLQCISINNAVANQSGSYALTVTDVHGCTGTSSTIVTIDFPINVTATTTGNKITAVATGGTPSFQYTIMPGNQTNSTGIFQNLAPGTYTITATDQFGCTASSQNIVITVGVVEPYATWGLTATPNPSNGWFTLRLPDVPTRDLQCTLHDANGQTLRSFMLNATQSDLNLTDLPSGFYILRVSDGENTGALRLAILH